MVNTIPPSIFRSSLVTPKKKKLLWWHFQDPGEIFCQSPPLFHEVHTSARCYQHPVQTMVSWHWAVVSCSTVWDAAWRCGCSPTVLATQSLRSPLTLTGPKLTFRSEEKWKRHVITPLSYALLEGPKAVWFVLLQFVVFLVSLCFKFSLVSVSMMCIRTSVGTKCTMVYPQSLFPSGI